LIYIQAENENLFVFTEDCVSMILLLTLLGATLVPNLSFLTLL